MNAYGSGMRIRKWMLLCIVVTLGACEVGYSEVTSTKPYADFIGAKYSVVADNLRAYGVYGSDNKTLSYIRLTPHPIGGPEYAFRRSVRQGQVIRILSAWRRVFLFDTSVYYRVALENSNLPQGIPIELELIGGNEGAGAELNPTVYKRLPSGN